MKVKDMMDMKNEDYEKLTEADKDYVRREIRQVQNSLIAHT